MRLRSTLTISLILTANYIMASPTALLNNYTVQQSGIQTFDFPVGVNSDIAHLPPEYASSNGWNLFGIKLRIDTHFVDLVFRSRSSNAMRRVSEGTASLSGYLAVAPLITQIAAGTVVPVAQQPGIYDVFLGVSGNNSNSDAQNLLLTGDLNHRGMIQLLVNTDAIAAAGGTYQFVFANVSEFSQIRYSDNSGNSTVSLPLGLSGGKITVVPEPGSLIALAGFSVLLFRRCK